MLSWFVSPFRIHRDTFQSEFGNRNDMRHPKVAFFQNSKVVVWSRPRSLEFLRRPNVWEVLQCGRCEQPNPPPFSQPRRESKPRSHPGHTVAESLSRASRTRRRPTRTLALLPQSENRTLRK